MGTGFFDPNKDQQNNQEVFVKDISCVEAFNLLKEDKDSVLVDVRTIAEWSFVGGVELSSVNKSPIYIQWNVYPSMNINSNFAQQLEQEIGNNKNRKILFLCRSGARSFSAASEMINHGYTECYNILEGFEGDVNANGHRGQKNGWKASKLPWGQK